MYNEEYVEKQKYYRIKVGLFGLNFLIFSLISSLLMAGAFFYWKHNPYFIHFYYKDALVNVLFFGGLLIFMIGLLITIISTGKTDPNKPVLNKYEKRYKAKHPFSYQTFSDNAHFYYLYGIKNPRKFYPETIVYVGAIAFAIGLKLFYYFGFNNL